MTVERNVEVEFCVCDFSPTGLRKMAAIYSHASGREVTVNMVVWPNPVMVTYLDLNDVAVDSDERSCR